ncbi:AFG1/ZapE family ATPase [Shigella flexneri]
MKIIYQELIKAGDQPPGPVGDGAGGSCGINARHKAYASAWLIDAGGGGRGKTWPTDLFYQARRESGNSACTFTVYAAGARKLTALQGQTDPLEIIADCFKAETDVLCFDEFFVSDMSDAMPLGGPTKALFTRASPWQRRQYSAGRTLSKWPATCAFSACNRCH